MKKTILLVLLILTCKENADVKAPANSIESLVISKAATLYNGSGKNACAIETAQFLDRLFVLNTTVVNDKVNVKLINGSNGWVAYKDISLLTNTKKNDIGDGLEFSFPDNTPFSFKGKRIDKNALSQLIIFYEFESKNFKITIWHKPQDDFSKTVKMQKESCKENAKAFIMPEPPVVKEYIFNNLTGLYISWYEGHVRTKYYEIYMPGKNRDTYCITVQMKSRTFTPFEEILAKKILFSARVK